MADISDPDHGYKTLVYRLKTQPAVTVRQKKGTQSFTVIKAGYYLT